MISKSKKEVGDKKMERKKRLILIFSLVVLAVGVVFLLVWVRKGNKPTKEQKAFADNFSRTMQVAKNETTTGTIESIDSEKIILRLGQKSTVVKINKDTRVVILDKMKKATDGQISDVKVGAIIKVEYNKTTTETVLVTLVKI
jgi:preprotein translocase subunit YajC